MELKTLIKDFIDQEDGAVTVDWVVLTAAIVGLAVAVYGVISQGVQDLSTDIDTQLKTDQIKTTFN
ncbi:pilus assembly protein [Tropicimonas sp. S265A]|uniref:pilus assembly protein n=1 Tax=Tropicimonas sp. S265A TaxID=3415134 RepID=UPI003C7BB04D